MKIVTRHLAIALLAVAASTAFATAADPTRQRTDTASASAVTAAQKVLSLRDFERTYELSNGRSMIVTSFGDAVRVSYGRRHAKTLHHDGNGNFASRDGKLVLQFDLDGDGLPHQVRLSLPAEWL